jgi:hypothetical protein
VININYIQIISGLEDPILSSTHNISLMNKNWILHIWEFLVTINAMLNINNLWKPAKARANDQFLMQAAINEEYSTGDLTIFNNWRLFFQVSRLSDICNAEGNKILKRYLICPLEDTNETDRETEILWPYQKRPDNTYFNVWRRVIMK